MKVNKNQLKLKVQFRENYVYKMLKQESRNKVGFREGVISLFYYCTDFQSHKSSVVNLLFV
jgi:hypothetical protein